MEKFGNLKWKDGIQDTEIIWEPNPKGRWSISICVMEKFKVGQRIELFEVLDASRYAGVVLEKGKVLPGMQEGSIVHIPCYDMNITIDLVSHQFANYKIETRKVGAVIIKSLKPQQDV